MTTPPSIESGWQPEGHRSAYDDGPALQYDAEAGDNEAPVAFALYLVYLLSYFLRLPARVEILGTIRFELVLAAVLLLLAFRAWSREIVSTETHKQLTWLILYILFSLPFVEWPGSVIKTNAQIFLKGFVFYVFTVSFAYTPSRLRLVFLLFIVCQGFRILEPLYLHVTTGYWGSATYIGNGEYAVRLSGSPYDIINPNGLGAIIAVFIAVGQPLSSTMPFFARLTYYVGVPASVYALILTLSRTGAVGLMAALAVGLLRGRRMLGALFLAASVIAVGAATLTGLESDRLLSIFGSGSTFADTASGRIEGLQADLGVAMETPLFGHGLGTSIEANAHTRGVAQPSHNLYIEIAQELGIVGVVLFLLYMWSVYRNLRACLRNVRTSPQQTSLYASLTYALQMWFWLELVFSLASYGLSLYSWYLLGGMSVVLRQYTRPDDDGESQLVEDGTAVLPSISSDPSHALRRAAETP